MLSVLPVLLSALAFTGPTGDLAPANVDDLLVQHAEVLHLGPGDTLRDLRHVALHNGYVLHVRRYHQGVPVLGESASLRYDAHGVLQQTHSDFHPLSPSGTPTVSAVEARISAFKATWGINLPTELFRKDAFDDSLAIDGATHSWIYQVHVPGLLPHQNREVWVDALTGEVTRIIDPTRHSTSARVFTPHPNPTGDLSDTTAVELENLTSDNALTGQWANSHNCLTGEADRQVYTCDDLIPIFAGQMGIGGATCADPLIGSFVGEYKHMVLAICGPTHKATPQGDQGYLQHSPVEPSRAQVPFPDPAFEDEFAEINLYYHIDRATEWFRAIGHPATANALDGAVNVSVPSGALMECGRAEMTSANATDHETGVAAVTTCLEQLRANQQAPFTAMPNAFFSPAGPLTSLLGFDNGGIFFFQGPTADFGYDGDVIYHEFGHNIVSQSGNAPLTGGNLMDPWGLDDSPGALNEAYADYFAGAITADPVIGGYVGPKSLLGDGIRRMDHTLSCPDFWAGQVHIDSLGWAGALWEARPLYPQTDIHPLTGREFRLFDRAVLEGLKTLTTNATYGQAAEATLSAVANERGLEDPNADLLREVLSERNVLDCKRVRPLTLDTPIRELFLAAAAGPGGPAQMMGGGRSFSPYAPPPVQFKVTPADLAPAGERPECATFAAELSQGAMSTEDLPDLLGTGEDGTPTYSLKLLYNTAGPIEFNYSGNVVVSSPQAENVIDVTVNTFTPTFTAPLYFPEDVETLHYALVNAGQNGPRLQNIRLIKLNTDCQAPRSDEPVRPVMVVEPPADTGCGCQSTSPSSLLLFMALGGWILRRKRAAAL